MDGTTAYDRLMKLYHRSVPGGNYSGDISRNGGNATLKRAIVALDLDDEDGVARRFREADTEYDDRQDAALDRINAERGA